MKRCMSCGNLMNDNEKFCSKCGGRGEELPVQAPVQQAPVQQIPVPQAPVPQVPVQQAPMQPTPVQQVPVQQAAPAAPTGKVCPSCGWTIAANLPFCPNCGAPQAAAPAPAPAPAPMPAAAPLYMPGAVPAAAAAGTYAIPQKKSKKKLVLGLTIGGVLLIAAVAAVLFFCVFNKKDTPSKKFLSAQEKMVKGMGTYLPSYETVKDFSTDMNLSVQVGGVDPMVSAILGEASIDLKVDMSGDTLVADAGVNLAGTQVLAGTVTYGDGRLGVYIPALDETYYTIDLDKILDLSGANQALSALTLPQIDEKELEELISRYTDVLFSVVNDGNVTIEENGSVRLEYLSERRQGEIYVFAPTASDFEQMVLKLADTLENDRQLRDLFDKVMSSVTQNIPGVSIPSSALADLDGLLKEAAGELRDHAAEIGREAGKLGFRWTVGLQGDEVFLNSIELSNPDLRLAYESVEGESVFYLTTEGTTLMAIDLNYWEENGLYSGYLTMTVWNSYGRTELEGYFDFSGVDLEKKSILGIPYGEYGIYIEDVYITFTVEGSGGGTDHRFSISNVPGLGYLDVVLHTSDKRSTASVPTAPREDLTNYSERQMEDLLEYLGDRAEQMAGDLASGLISGYGW